MAYELSGLVKSVGPVVQVTEKFSKRELVVKHGDKYPQESLFETSGDRNSLLDGVRVGDRVVVAFDLRGREARNGKTYNTLAIYKLRVDDLSSSRAPSTSSTSSNDDLPF